MKNYTADLYGKFLSSTINILQENEFYDYFTNVVESGVRHYAQKNEMLVKIIDEKWVKAIEECIIPLENIILKPRRFIMRDENVVPIELAKKVGPDAVKHLATHTHYISRITRQGDVIPGKILNVSNEESFDIYENRFIITLINRLYDFLNRRYDAIFKTTGDEFASMLKVDSTFNDNDEKIEYNLTVKMYQGQSYLDNKNNDSALYERIEYFKMMIDGFKKSEFYQALASCTAVRSPINKTNLITKEPNFKKCYDLWQFLDKYTDTGYKYDRRAFNVDFEEEYVNELNLMMLLNYMVMKNNLEERNEQAFDFANAKRKRTLKPKFIKHLIEEFVFDMDIPEVELRQIFNEELQKAYNTKTENEEEILEILRAAIDVEVEKKEEEDQEREILEAIRRAIGLDKIRKQEEKEMLAEKRRLEKEKKEQARLEKEQARIEKEQAKLQKEQEKLAKAKEKADKAADQDT